MKSEVKIGNNIRIRRESLGMSQQELAEGIGYKNRSTIGKIEKGERKITVDMISKIAAVLKTTSAELIRPGIEDSLEDSRKFVIEAYDRMSENDKKHLIEYIKLLRRAL